MCFFSVLPMRAQTVSLPVGGEVSTLERLALFDLSGDALTPAQSQAMVAALGKVCREEGNFVLISETALTGYLKKHPHFSVLVSDNVQALCQDLAIAAVITLTFESASPVETPADSGSPSAPAWQVTLRWLDGSTGQMTKTLAREFAGDINVPETLPLRDFFHALMESPEVIMPVDNPQVEMPAPAVGLPDAYVPGVDSAATNNTAAAAPSYQSRRGRPWLWYFTGAAILSGGSAALLLRKSPSSAATVKTLLPEPPDPPK